MLLAISTITDRDSVSFSGSAWETGKDTASCAELPKLVVGADFPNDSQAYEQTLMEEYVNFQNFDT